MPKTVWTVECGEYSSKYIAAVFTNRDNADAYARARDGVVDEFETDPPLEDWEQRHLRPGLHHFIAHMDIDGNDADAGERWDSEPERIQKLNALMRKGEPVRVSMACWATDKEHAIKQLNDTRAAFLASSYVPPKDRGKPDYGGWVTIDA